MKGLKAITYFPAGRISGSDQVIAEKIQFPIECKQTRQAYSLKSVPGSAILLRIYFR